MAKKKSNAEILAELETGRADVPVARVDRDGPPSLFGLEQHPEGKPGESGFHFRDMAVEGPDVPAHIVRAEIDREAKRVNPVVEQLDKDLVVCQRLADQVDGPIKGLEQATDRAQRKLVAPIEKAERELYKSWGQPPVYTQGKARGRKGKGKRNGRRWNPGGKGR